VRGVGRIVSERSWRMSCAPQAHRRSRVRVGSPGRCVLGTAVHSRSAGRAARLLTPCLRFWLESLRDAFGAPLVDREARSSYTLRPVAVVAELADALDSGSSGVKPMEVQVLSTALKPRTRKGPRLFFGVGEHSHLGGRFTRPPKTRASGRQEPPASAPRRGSSPLDRTEAADPQGSAVVFRSLRARQSRWPIHSALFRG
jgi:hypothetical protein